MFLALKSVGLRSNLHNLCQVWEEKWWSSSKATIQCFALDSLVFPIMEIGFSLDEILSIPFLNQHHMQIA